MQNQEQKIEHYSSLSKIVQTAPAHIYWKSVEGVYLGCNDRMAKLIGFSSCHDVIGKRDADLLSERDAKRVEEADRAIIAS